MNRHAFLVIANNGSKTRKVNMSPKDKIITLMMIFDQISELCNAMAGLLTILSAQVRLAALFCACVIT